MASVEAMIQVDGLSRAGAELQDPVSTALRALEHRRIDDILDVWRDLHPNEQLIVSQLKECFTDIRHWLGHGRYWVREKQLAVDAFLVRDRARNVQKHIARFPSVDHEESAANKDQSGDGVDR